MKNIAIVGAGQLGTRHLQSLASLEDKNRILVVDPSEFGQDLAFERWNETEKKANHKLSVHSNIKEINDSDIDLAIIATNSNVRKQVIDDCLDHLKVKYFILEKFLFQKIDDYKTIGKLLSDKTISTYVNCPRRLYPDYQIIKKNIDSRNKINLKVSGNNWGIGSNSVHFADLFLWLTGELVESWENELNAGFFDSKREGFIEFSGGLTGRTKSGHTIQLSSNLGTPNKVTVEITDSQAKWTINEIEGSMVKVKIENDSKTIDNATFTVKRQSELTSDVAKKIFDTGHCLLTPYEDSANLHIPLLRVFKDHYSKSIETNQESCPIT